MHVLNLSFFSKKKIYIIVISAIIIACILIYISFFSVVKSSIDNMLNNSAIFNVNSYIAEYEISEISNKNRNVYNMSEIYKKENSNEYFKFSYKDFLGNEASYIVTNDRIKISNESQISSYILNSNNFKKTNLFSFATYADIINNIDNIKCIKLEVSKEENMKKYQLILDKNVHDTVCKNSSTCKYDDLFSNGLKLSKIEISVADDKPVDILVYTTDNNVYIDVKFIKFEANSDISSDIFKF